jgi:trigger factor
MRSTVEPLEGNKVKLSVEVEADEFDKAVDDAFRKLANQVNVRGFRRGKVPRKVLEAHLGGPAIARQQALQDSLPDYYAEAVRNHEVDVIASPEIDITSGAEDGPVAFDAVVEIRPSVEISGYDDLQITVPRPDVIEADVDERIDRLRTQNAEFEAADRPAADGDQVLVDITGSQDGEEIEGLVAEDYLYEVGSGAVVPEIDENLRGAKAGDHLSFDAKHPEEEDAELHFDVDVKEVRASVLPELTDEWVAENTEHETEEAWRADLREQISRARLVGANMAMQQRAAEALAGLVGDDVPEALVDGEVSARIQNFAMRLRQQNIELGRYLELTGTTTEQLVEQHREPSLQAIKVDLALRAVAEAEGLEATAEDIDKHFDELARQYGVPAEQIRENFDRAGQLPAVRSEIRKGKALDWVLERVSLVDEDGNPVERSALELPTTDQAADELTGTDSLSHEALNQEALNQGASSEDASGGDASPESTAADQPADALGEDRE